MTKQLRRLQQNMQEAQIDVSFLQSPENVVYFSGYESNPHERVLALIVFADSDPFLFTPALEEEDARQSGWPYDVYSYQDHESPFDIIEQAIKKKHSSILKIGVEEETLPLGRFKQLSTRFSESAYKDLTSMLQKLKLIKTSDEIHKMKEAGRTADLALKIGFDSLREGITEQEVVAEIEYQLKKQGVSEMSFSTEVLFGGHAASPHGVPGNRKLKKNEFVLFDLGTIHEGYASDVTRTVAFGSPSQKEREVYEVVLKAHMEALKAVRPGVRASQLDAIAREVIEQAGYGNYFTHRLGHGIGKSIHEFPSIMQGNDLVLQEGMCFSIEPGIYIPDSVGVRIEDCMYVTADGCVPFTHTPKEYQEL